MNIVRLHAAKDYTNHAVLKACRMHLARCVNGPAEVEFVISLDLLSGGLVMNEFTLPMCDALQLADFIHQIAKQEPGA